MPTATIMLYFNENDYMKYLKNKKELNKRARELIYKEVKK